MDRAAAMDFDFDEIIERRGTHSSKWDGMEAFCGLSPKDGLPMWVADMDFRPPAPVQRAAGTGPFGYRRERELSPHEQFFMVLLSPRTPLEIKRKLRTWEARVLDGEITPQETQDLRFMYQSFVVG